MLLLILLELLLKVHLIHSYLNLVFSTKSAMSILLAKFACFRLAKTC